MTNKHGFWTKNFSLLFLSNALLFMVYNMQVPVLPLYGVKIGLSASEIGLFVGAIMFSSLIIRVFAGQLASHFSKKALILLGVALYLFTTLGYFVVSGLMLLVLLRLINGIGHGLATTYFATTAADELPLEDLGKGMGYFGVGSMLTASLAPVLALNIAQKIGYSVFWEFCALILLISFILIVLTDKAKNSIINKDAIKLSVTDIFDATLLQPNILVFILGLIMSGVMTFTSIYAKQQHLTAIVWFFFCCSCCWCFDSSLYREKI